MKKVIKNVLLYLCVMALALQPVISYASITNYNPVTTISVSNWNDFDNTTLGYNNIPNYGNVFIQLNPNSSSEEITRITALFFRYSLSYYDYYAIYDYTDSIIYAAPYSLCKKYDYTSRDRFFNLTSSSVDVYTYDFANSTFGSLSVPSGGNLQLRRNSGTNSIYCYYNGGFTIYYTSSVVVTDQPDYAISFNDDSPYIPSPSPNNPAIDSNVDYSLNIYYQIAMFLSENFNCWTPNGQSHFNPTWVGVGQELTYEYLCKTNIDSETVTITLSDGSQVTVDNYLYGSNKDYSSNLASILNELVNIKSNTNTTNTTLNTTNSRLSTLNNSINNQMDETQAKLDAVYPEDEIQLNNTIADSVTDDSTGHGLTASNISKGKDAVDEGISTFELDTSGSSYTSPFSALSDSDWSFWTQTTYNNLGSGYSFDSAAVLMESESDVYESNQNTLLNLLGW